MTPKGPGLPDPSRRTGALPRRRPTASPGTATIEPEPWEGEHCNDCGRGYSDVYWLPDAWWRAIAPDADRPAAGSLCPDCALDRLQALQRVRLDVSPAEVLRRLLGVEDE